MNILQYDHIGLQNQSAIAVAYLARGQDADWQASCERFLASYLRHASGMIHQLHVIFKGYENDAELASAERIFSRVRHTPVYLEDSGFDISAYARWARLVADEQICVFGGTAEILSDNWLLKLSLNLRQPDVGLVGATGSLESLSEMGDEFPPFPNPHIRSNAFMISRSLFCRLTDGVVIRDKVDAYKFESGAKSLTKQVLLMKKKAVVVGRNGRGYSPPNWPTSETFRMGRQSNLLVADKQTRMFAAATWNEKSHLAALSWGGYLQQMERLSDH